MIRRIVRVALVVSALVAVYVEDYVAEDEEVDEDRGAERVPGRQHYCHPEFLGRAIDLLNKEEDSSRQKDAKSVDKHHDDNCGSASLGDG